MSDTFDHEWDAWESRFNDEDEDSYFSYQRDSNYYHTKIQYKILNETEKSYKMNIVVNGFKVANIWIPKKICKNFKNNTVLVHENTLLLIIKNMKEKEKECAI